MTHLYLFTRKVTNMLLEKGIFFRTKSEYDSEFILAPTSNFNRTTYLNLRLLIRTIISIPLAFHLGYLIYYNCNTISDIINFLLIFSLMYVISFYLIQVPHELIHYLIYSNFLSDENAKIKILNRKRLITTVYNGNFKPFKVISSLLMPLFIISLILAIFILLKGYNSILYGILCSNLIICSDDILNLFIYMFASSEEKGLYELPNDYNYLISTDKKQDE